MMNVDVYTLAHEVKNPLAVCKGYLEMLNDTNLGKYKELIAKNLCDAIEIIDNYLEYRKLTIKKDIMDLVLLCEEVINNYKELYDVNFKMVTVYEELYVQGDYERLRQIFNNIVKNSYEAHAKNINIYLKIVDKEVIIKVIDDGDGINNLSLIGSGHTSKIKGNGIGTLITKEIINDHEGTINYAKGEPGCEITMKLPIII